jgi:hypothetical protein
MNQLSTPKIVSMIAALTRHRDVSLLETSLLKTVADLFAPDWAAIFHIGDDDVPVFSTSLREGIVSQTDFPEPFSELIGTEGVTSFPIMSHAHKVLGYLLVHRQPQLSEEERTLMTELFRVYDNYLSVLRTRPDPRLVPGPRRREIETQGRRRHRLLLHGGDRHRPLQERQ